MTTIVQLRAPRKAAPVARDLASDLAAIAEQADDIRAAIGRGETGYAALSARNVARAARAALLLIGGGRGGGR